MTPWNRLVVKGPRERAQGKNHNEDRTAKSDATKRTEKSTANPRSEKASAKEGTEKSLANNRREKRLRINAPIILCERAHEESPNEGENGKSSWKARVEYSSERTHKKFLR